MLCLDELRVGTFHITQVGTRQTLEEECFCEYLLRNRLARFRTESRFSRAGSLHVMEDGERKAPLPAHAAHDKAGARVVLGTSTCVLCEAQRFHEIRLVGVRLETIEM